MEGHEVAGLTINLLDHSFLVHKETVFIWIASLTVIAMFTIMLKTKKGHAVMELIAGFGQDQFMSVFHHYTRFWLVFFITVFIFILTNNLMGAIPFIEPPSSNINFTASMAIFVICTAFIINIRTRGIHFLKLFMPSGVPLLLQPVIFLLEIITYCMRPFSLSVRLFANMFAGHMIIVVLFQLLVIIPIMPGKLIPLLAVVAIKLFELFVCFIQAFIFTILSASYVAEAMSTEH